MPQLMLKQITVNWHRTVIGDVIAKITEFHTHVDFLQSPKCEVCLEQFPSLRVNNYQCCRQCAIDKHVPNLLSCQNNMNPRAVPPELTVSW